MALAVAMQARQAYVWRMLSPQDLMDIALRRHRQPWNMTFQIIGMAFCIPALLFHSSICFSIALIFMGLGFMKLRLAPMPYGRWRNMLDHIVAAEVRWLNTPKTIGTWLRTVFILALLIFIMWALWVQDIATISLIIAVWAVYLAYCYNKTTGIDA